MSFRTKLEAALTPLIEDLRARIRLLPTLDVLNHYQLQIDAVQTDKSHVPDGFMFKWRYAWALLLSNPFVEASSDDPADFRHIDKLIEDIFDAYAAGAIYDRGRFPGSEKEFLTRLGLGLRVREPDLLAFPEQLKRWASTRLRPFDDSYFLPTFGIRFGEVTSWFDGLIRNTETRLNEFVQDLTSIAADIKPLQSALAQGELTSETVRNRAHELRIKERLAANARLGERIHIFSPDELGFGIRQPVFEALVKQFGVRPGQITSRRLFPHDESPLGGKFLVALPDGRFYFLDPANAYSMFTKTLERNILEHGQLRTRYLRNRDRATERWVADSVRRVFPEAKLFPNYYLEKGGHEKDLLVHYGDVLILIEAKNSRVRPFKGATADLSNFHEDFKNSVQLGFAQALAVKRRILEREEATFFDKKGRTYFSIRRREIEKFYILCVTVTPRGPFGTDLSYELAKSEEEPFPLALNLLDLDTICKHFNGPTQFIAYLEARQLLHGRVRTGDELNYAGYFLKYGNLDFPGGTLVTDDFSSLFDRAWFREKGISVHEPNEPPVATSMVREGNRLRIQRSTGQWETLKIPPEVLERFNRQPPIRMKGEERNKPCPCGSGRKLKHCCGVD